MTRKNKRWSAEVTQPSDALDLESNVFRKRSAREIAHSLKRSAEARRSSQRDAAAVGDVDVELLY